MNPEMEAGVSTCGNCRSPMPQGYDFVVIAGFALGKAPLSTPRPFAFRMCLPEPCLATMLQIQALTVLRVRRFQSATRWNGNAVVALAYVLDVHISLLIFFMAAAGLTAIVKQVRPRIRDGGVATVAAPKSYAGVDEFETADGDIGVTFANVDTPDGPADKAGLVGGDIITTVDSQPVRSDDEMTALMQRTPIGKTIDIVYIRDGETKNTKLTTISREELNRLGEVFERRPEGRGSFGYTPDEANRVEIPGTKLFGVQLGEVLTNRPADMAGIKPGDIVIKFGDIPIRTAEEFRARVRRATPYSTVDLTVIRNGEQMKIPVKMGKG